MAFPFCLVAVIWPSLLCVKLKDQHQVWTVGGSREIRYTGSGVGQPALPSLALLFSSCVFLNKILSLSVLDWVFSSGKWGQWEKLPKRDVLPIICSKWTSKALCAWHVVYAEWVLVTAGIIVMNPCKSPVRWVFSALVYRWENTGTERRNHLT